MSDTSFSTQIRNKATFGAPARGIWLLTIAGLLGAAVCGCDTPYTKRVRQLDDAYQTGDLPREDYLRFAHEEEQWDQVHTSNSFWSK